MDSSWKGGCFISSFQQSTQEDLDVKPSIGEGTHRPFFAFPARVTLSPFGEKRTTMHLKGKLYFIITLSSRDKIALCIQAS